MSYVVCKLNKYCHVTPFLHILHWLAIQCHILFKYNLLTYKAIHFSQPPYLSSLIRRSDLTRGNCLSISSSKPNKHSGLCSFIVAAPTEWNKLPQAIRTIESISSFKKQLKTYLFRLAYTSPVSDANMEMDLFLELDYPFLDISSTEDVYINFGAL